MKNLLVVPLVLLSVYVIADERVILGSLELHTEDVEIEHAGTSVKSALNGFGVQFFRFADSGYYFGGKFSRLTGDSESCVRSHCLPSNTDFSQTIFSGEMGWSYGDWTPFFGISFVDEDSRGESADYSSFTTGAWLAFDAFRLRGAITKTQLTDFSSSRTWVSGGFLYPMANDWALSADFGTEIQGDRDGFRFSFQFGRTL